MIEKEIGPRVIIRGSGNYSDSNLSIASTSALCPPTLTRVFTQDLNFLDGRTHQQRIHCERPPSIEGQGDRRVVSRA